MRSELVLGIPLAETLLLVPDLLVTLLRILFDPSTPAGRRLLGGTNRGQLVLSGTENSRLLDGVGILLLAANEMLEATEPATVSRYWPGTPTGLQKAHNMLTNLQSKLPARVHNRWQAVRPF